MSEPGAEDGNAGGGKAGEQDSEPHPTLSRSSHALMSPPPRLTDSHRRRYSSASGSGAAPDRVQFVFPDPPLLDEVTALRQVGGALVAFLQLRSIGLEIPWSSALGLRVCVCVLKLAGGVCV